MALNLQSLKQEFLEYLAKIGKQDSIDAKEFMKSTSSIFSMSGDFKNFLQNEKHIDPEKIYGNLNQIIEQNIKDLATVYFLFQTIFDLKEFAN